MRFDRPIVALDAAAVGETLAGAGILLPERDVAQTAEAAAMLIEQKDLRERYAAAARLRLRDFDGDLVARQTREALGL